MQKFIRATVIGALALLLTTALVAPALAADDKSWVESILGRPFIPKECTQSGTPQNVNACGLDAALQIIINSSKLIVAFAGSAALLMFVYGGTLWIIAAGSPEKIEKGKTAMASAVIGIAIILGAWLIVNFSILAITGGKIGETGKIFDRNWSSPPASTGQSSSGGQTSPDKEYFVKDQRLRASDRDSAELMCTKTCQYYPGDFAFVTEVSLVSGMDYTCSCYPYNP